MNDFTVLMALADFIPVILFAAGAVVVQRCLYNKMSKGAFALFAAGTIDVIVAGGCKALWKLLYALCVCDFAPLNTIFFPLQSVGFLLAGIGIVAMLCHRQKGGDGKLCAVAVPAVFSGTFVFVALMIAGLAAMDIGLCVVSCRMKKGALTVLFVLSLICSVGMGYLASKDFSEAAMNWLAEGINIVGQGAFLAGALLLKKAGLAGYVLPEKK